MFYSFLPPGSPIKRDRIDTNDLDPQRKLAFGTNFEFEFRRRSNAYKPDERRRWQRVFSCCQPNSNRAQHVSETQQ